MEYTFDFLDKIIVKVARKILPGCTLLGNLRFITQIQAEQVNWSEPALAPWVQFFIQAHIAQQFWPDLSYIDQIDLPAPYDFLLTQPLMTLGIAKYYQRSPKLRSPLYTIDNPNQKTYSRAIIMMVDNNKQRDDALTADEKNDTTVVELGFIDINFAVLPQKVIDGILHTQTPLGALLAAAEVITHNQDVRYFKVDGNSVLDPFLNCAKHPILYGRTNTLMRSDNGQWLARVVEVLTGSSLPTTQKES